MRSPWRSRDRASPSMPSRPAGSKPARLRQRNSRPRAARRRAGRERRTKLQRRWYSWHPTRRATSTARCWWWTAEISCKSGRVSAATGGWSVQRAIEMRVATVDEQPLAGGVAGALGKQEDHRVGDLLGCRHALAERDAAGDLIKPRFRIVEGF